MQFGEVLRIADTAIQEGKATPMVIVMPDANTGHRGYFNDIGNEWRYEDFFFEEFVPFIESTYRVKGEKRYRAVAGTFDGRRWIVRLRLAPSGYVLFGVSAQRERGIALARGNETPAGTVESQ